MSDAPRVLAGLRQPDRWSCGATAVVGWRVLTDPAYAASVRGREPAAVLAAHRALVSPRDRAGRWQVPWPRRLGTPPWSLARAVGGRVRWATWDRLTDAVADGSPAALYVGSRLLPLHVVLAVDLEGQEVVVHDPARGSAVRFDQAALEEARLPFTGRPRAWWLVLPAVEFARPLNRVSDYKPILGSTPTSGGRTLQGRRATARPRPTGWLPYLLSRDD